MAWWPCGNKKSAPPAPVNQWAILYSPGMPAAPQAVGNGFRLDFPVAGSLHYVVRGHAGAIKGVITADIEIVVPEGVTFTPQDAGEGPPCKMTFYFQRRGDDLTASKPYHRWFSSQNVPLVNTPAASVSIPLDPALWGSVFGKKGNEVPAEFAAALADVQGVGVTFSGKHFAGHGVTASSASHIIVSSFNVG